VYRITCPRCGRFMVETDAPPGYHILAPCQRCKGQQRVPTGEKKPAPPRRPDPLRYR